MASGWTNKGKMMVGGGYFCSNAIFTQPTNLYVILLSACPASAAACADVNTVADLSELTTANGYTAGGFAIGRNATNWAPGDGTTLGVEDDALDRLVVKQAVAASWTASGAGITAAGCAVVSDRDTAGGLAGTVGTRVPLVIIDFGGSQSASSGNTFQISNTTFGIG